MDESDAIKKRRQKAERILKKAEYYKVCEGCESVVLYDMPFCPVCDAYRFDDSVNRVIKTVMELAKKERTSVLPEDFI